MSESASSRSDRRQHERKVFRGTAHLIFPGRPMVEVRTVLLSANGVAIAASANPPMKLVCTIRVSLPVKLKGYASFELQAEVTHSVFSSAEDGFVVGLKFINAPADMLAAISDYLVI